MKTLDTSAKELEASLKRFSEARRNVTRSLSFENRMTMARYILTPKRCPNSWCRKLVTDQDELIMMYHENECATCSHVRGDVLSQ